MPSQESEASMHGTAVSMCAAGVLCQHVRMFKGLLLGISKESEKYISEMSSFRKISIENILLLRIVLILWKHNSKNTNLFLTESYKVIV